MTLPSLHRFGPRLDFRTSTGPPAAAPMAVVLMALLTGCAGVVSGLPFTAPQPYTETDAALDGGDLRSAHVAGLNESETYRTNVSLVIDGDDQTVRVDRAAAANTTADRAVSTSRYHTDAVTGDGLVVTAYTAADVTYRRAVLDVRDRTVTEYDAARAPYDDGLLAVQPVTASDAARADLVETVVDDVDWTQLGVERYDGGWVTRYEASGTENFSAVEEAALVEGQGERADDTAVPETFDVDVRSINATLLVSPDGVVRYLSVHATGNAAGEPVELTLTMSTDGLGTATVEPPAWVEDARQRTDV